MLSKAKSLDLATSHVRTAQVNLSLDTAFRQHPLDLANNLCHKVNGSGRNITVGLIENLSSDLSILYII